MGNFIWPHTIAITRAPAQSGVGAVAYGGGVQSNEVTVLSGLPASIQRIKGSGKNSVGLPADVSLSRWRIFTPPRAGVSAGAVRERDVVTDELGRRYAVVVAYWNSLGLSLEAELLEP